MSSKILHTMIRVFDLDKSIAFYRDVLGMQVLKKNDYPGGKFTLCFMGYGTPGSHEIELTYNWDPEKRYELGNGYGHIAIGVPDAYKTCEDVTSKGGKVTRPAGPMMHGTTVIAFVEDPDGYKAHRLAADSHLWEWNSDQTGQDGYLVQKKRVIAINNDRIVASSLYDEENIEEATAPLLNERRVLIDVHVLFSHSYSVPSLYFRALNDDGSPIMMKELWKLLPFAESDQSDMWTTTTFQEHPILHIPYYQIHPCNTARVLHAINPDSEQYLTAFLSVFGQMLGGMVKVS